MLFFTIHEVHPTRAEHFTAKRKEMLNKQLHPDKS